MTANRAIPPLDAGERAMLIAWLELQRQTLLVKCEGLTDEQHARHLGHADLIRERIDGRTGV